jgi:RNA-directed DNA polymerase
MDTHRESAPSAVPATATQGGDILARWAWVEPAVWTERMLTALEQGVKGGVWHRWPNAFFAKHGYFSLAAAHAAARQSPSG